MSDTIFEFRKLTAQDVFPMFKILSKIGIDEFADVFGKENVQKLMAGVSGGNITTMMGISVTLEMANIVLGNLPLGKWRHLNPNEVKYLIGK